jgi:DNA-binding XRE family transcriptional regulator
MKLTAKNKYNKKTSEVIGITRDGWCVTKNGAFGDVGEDCEIELDFKQYIKDFRKEHKLSQQELAWMLGKCRTTVIALEKGVGDITLKDFLIMSKLLQDNYFEEIAKNLKLK